MRTGDARLGLLATMGLGLWLFWALQPRSLTFMHYMFTSIPFVAIALAAWLWSLWQAPDATTEEPPLMSTTARRSFVVGYLGLAVAWFGFYYPLFVSILLHELAHSLVAGVPASSIQLSQLHGVVPSKPSQDGYDFTASLSQS